MAFLSALSAAFGLFLASPAALAFTPPKAPEVELRSFEEVTTHFKKDGFSGVALVHSGAEGDLPLYEAALGTSDARTGAPMRLDAQFAIGSVTKQFAAAALLQLQEEGRLSLADPLSKYFPEYPRGNEITLKQLLSHTSGIFNYTSLPNFFDLLARPVSGLDELIGLFRDLPLDFEPGSNWSYSNSGYVLAGAIIEKVSGSPFGRFLSERLLGPAGMSDSAYTGLFTPERKVEGHEIDRDYEARRIDVMHLSWAHAAGGMHSTVRDLVRWNRALEEGRILSAASLAEMETPVLENYGLGVMISRFPKSGEERAVWHTGGLPGFSTMNFRVPAKRLSVVVLSNFMNFTSSAYARALAEIALTGRATVSTTPQVELPRETLEAYAGTYTSEALKTSARIQLEGARLYFAIEGQPELRLIPWGDEVFELKNLAFLKFRRDEKGQVTGFTLTQNGRDFEFGR